MTVTTAMRVDATHPVLAQLVDAAAKAFTGALEVTTTDSAGRDLQVSVWLEDGLIVAVHGAGFPVPAAAYVAHVTGYDFGDGDGVDAFAAAQQTEVDGRSALGQDDVYAAQLDWAHGLLASALTWPRPHVTRVKKATTSTDRIKPAPWQVLVSDVAARVDGLQSAWRAVCDSLAASGIPAVPAAQACAILTVAIPAHPLFNGEECLDQVAGRTGTSRYVVLEELSRALLSGAPATFGRALADEPLLIPEHFEDPEHGWATVSPQAQVVELVDADPATGDLPGDDAMRAAVEEALQDAGGEAPDLWGDGAPVPQEPLPPMPDLPPVYDFPEPAADPVPEVAPEPFPGPSDVTAPGSARELIDAWVRGASDGADEGVRRAIVERLLASAHSEALDCSANLTDRSQAYAQAEADAQAARTAIARTQEILAAARTELEQAEARVAGVEEEYRDVIELASSTEQVAQGAAERAELADDELRRLLELVAAARADAEAARGEAVRTRSAADAALTRMEETAGPALAAARQAAQRVRASQVAPAEVDVRGAQERAAAATEHVQRLHRELEVAQVAAQRAQAIVASFDAG